MAKGQVLGDLWLFMRVRRKWWLTPLVFVLVLLSTLMVLAHGSALSPFIYTIF
jgi:hypothetical protein